MKNTLKQAAIEITGTALSLVTTQDATASKQAVKNAAQGASAFINSGSATNTIAGIASSFTGNLSAQDGANLGKAIKTQITNKLSK